MSEQPADLDQLAYALEQAKENLATAKDKVAEAEQAIIAAVGHKDKGATTEKTQYYKVTTTGKQTVKIDPDQEKLAAVMGALPQEVTDKLFKKELKLDGKFLSKLQEANPDQYKIAARCLITTPAKTAVSVTRIEA